MTVLIYDLIPVRKEVAVWRKRKGDLAQWAEDEFRSVNDQIEYLLTECVKRRKDEK